MTACEGGVIGLAQPWITERLVGPGDIPEGVISICIVGVQVGMELLREPTKRAFDLLVGCPRQDTKHLVGVAHCVRHPPYGWSRSSTGRESFWIPMTPALVAHLLGHRGACHKSIN